MLQSEPKVVESPLSFSAPFIPLKSKFVVDYEIELLSQTLALK